MFSKGCILLQKGFYIFLSNNSLDFTARNPCPKNSMNVKLNPIGSNCVCAQS